MLTVKKISAQIDELISGRVKIDTNTPSGMKEYKKQKRLAEYLSMLRLHVEPFDGDQCYFERQLEVVNKRLKVAMSLCPIREKDKTIIPSKEVKHLRKMAKNIKYIIQN